MIDKVFLFPQYYIAKIPKCDDCKAQLVANGMQILTSPTQSVYHCPKCGKEYTFYDKDLQGEWKWRAI